ncbi:hypothetical protein [uncultured Maritimibacter sp.]|uniref:hypothetical protein n=1 Tax=uncultured Maritimibacter sp. TaxID=991866 RepID=UPI00262F8EA4|nr:hypothetical protein [uncultured Maritimibacter sp.]
MRRGKKRGHGKKIDETEKKRLRTPAGIRKSPFTGRSNTLHRDAKRGDGNKPDQRGGQNIRGIDGRRAGSLGRTGLVFVSTLFDIAGI